MIERSTTCPHCGINNTGHASVKGNDAPSPGDVSLCWSCHGLGLFTDDLDVRLPTPAEDAEIRAVPVIAAALRTLQRRMS
jgi:hypothetical protein